MDAIKNGYFAAKDAKDCVNVLLKKIAGFQHTVEISRYQDKLRNSWRFYYGAFNSSIGDAHQALFAGEQGEIAQLSVNHYRNLGQHMLTMITANRPLLEARAVNTDSKSLIQADLGNSLLDYYMREKRLETYFKEAVEMSIVLGAAWFKMAWNSTAGEAFEYDEESETDIYQGDVEFSVLSPFDVIFDTSKENNKHDWIITIGYKNKYDLMAKYPELAEKIDGVKTKSQLFRFGVIAETDETDDVPVYEFYHKKSEAIIGGRYTLFLSDDVVLYDGDLPYREIPVYRIAPNNIIGTPFGYTNLFDIMPIQEVLNSLYTTVNTNQNTFGVQSVLVPRGSDVTVEQLSGGLNFIEYNPQAGVPSALQLTSTPKEIFDFMAMLERLAETISGVNSVSRGNPESSLRSGNALALVQSMSLQFMSNLQHSYIMLLEQSGTALINMLKDFAKAPRIAAIVGKSHRTEMKEFNGDDLSLINRVIVDVGNPLSRSTAGRVEMAQQLLQMQAISTPQQYFQVLNTGRLDVMTEDETSELNYIRQENEYMLNGKPILAYSLDNHALHIKEHKFLSNDAEVRENPEFMQNLLNHIQEHINLLKTTDPMLLQMLGQQPIAPPAPPGAPPPGASPDMMQQPPAVPQEGLPQPAGIPSPPAPFENEPVLAEQMAPPVG